MVLGIEVAILRGKWLLTCLSRRVGWNSRSQEPGCVSCRHADVTVVLEKRGVGESQLKEEAPIA
jgi:hypothetical protein